MAKKKKEVVKTAKEMFVEEISQLMDEAVECNEMAFEGLSPQAYEYFEEVVKKPGKRKDKLEITDTGRKILEYMKEHKEENENNFKAKTVAEGLFLSARSVAGAMRKLINDGFAGKDNSEPINYSITEAGEEKIA